MATRSRARAADVYEELLAKAEVRDNAASKRGRYRCLLRLGDLRRYGGDAKRATAWYERARCAEPGRGEAQNGLGAVAQAGGRPVTAAYHWRRGRARRGVQAGGAQFQSDDRDPAGPRRRRGRLYRRSGVRQEDAAAASARFADAEARKALSASRLAECEARLEHAARRMQQFCCLTCYLMTTGRRATSVTATEHLREVVVAGELERPGGPMYAERCGRPV